MPISIDIRSETFHAFGEPSSWNPRSPEVRWDAVDSPTSRSQLAHQALGTGICVDHRASTQTFHGPQGSSGNSDPHARKLPKCARLPFFLGTIWTSENPACSCFFVAWTCDQGLRQSLLANCKPACPPQASWNCFMKFQGVLFMSSGRVDIASLVTSGISWIKYRTKKRSVLSAPVLQSLTDQVGSIS